MWLRVQGAKATFYSQDPMLAFQFVEELTTAQVRLTSVVATVIDFNIEDDVIVLDEDIYHSILIDSLDGGDTRTVTEATEKEEEHACDEDTSAPSDHVGARERSGGMLGKRTLISFFIELNELLQILKMYLL